MKNKPHFFVAIGLAVFAAGSVYAEESYTVSRGDSLGKIARQFGVSYVEIMEANDLKHTHIYEGQVLKIPADGSGATPANAGPVRITPRPVGAVDRYRAPGLDDPPEKSAIRKAIDEEESRVGQFSGEMPIQPLPGGDPPTVYVKPKKKAAPHTYPSPSAESRPVTLATTEVSGTSPFKGTEVLDLIPRPVKTVPLGSRMGTYIVQPGDTVRSISKDFSVNFWDLRKLNKIEFKKIYPGLELKIPGRAGRTRAIKVKPTR